MQQTDDGQTNNSEETAAISLNVNSGLETAGRQKVRKCEGTCRERCERLEKKGHHPGEEFIGMCGFCHQFLQQNFPGFFDGNVVQKKQISEKWKVRCGSAELEDRNDTDS